MFKRRVATVFNTKEELEKYLKEHPDADKSKHSVKQHSDTVKKQELTREVDLTQKNENAGKNGQYIHEKQLSDEDVITFADKSGNVIKKKVKEMSPEQRQEVSEQIRTCSLVHAKGFSDYSKVDKATFEKNKENVLNFLDPKNKIQLNTNTRETPVSSRMEGFIKENRENLDRVIEKYSAGVRSPIARKALEDYRDKLGEVIREACSKGGGMENVSEKDFDAYLQEDMKRLVYQEVETRRRSMGDHGIRHLVGNALNSVDILGELQKGGVGQVGENGKVITGKDKLLAMSTMINHDIGYTLGQVALNAAKGGFHKSYSGQIALEEKDRYSKIFGEDGMQKMVGTPRTYANGKPVLRREVDMVRDGKQMYETGNKLPNGKDELTDDVTKAKGYAEGKPKKASEWKDYAQEEVYDEKGNLKISEQEYQNCKIEHEKGKEGVIQYHDSSNYDWKNDPVGSAVALADCTALFGKDKVQEFFYKNDDAMKEVTKMQCIMNTPDDVISKDEKQKLFSGFKKKMYSMIENLEGATILDKDLLHSQVKEMEVGKFSTVDDILTRSSGVLQGFHYDGKSNQMTVETTYSEEGNILENMFGSDMARNQWSKLYKDIRGSGRIETDENGNQSLFKGNPEDANESKILVKINGFNGGKYNSLGVADVYENVPSFAIRQQIARLSECREKGKPVNLKGLDDLEAKLSKEENGKPCIGEKIFGSNWQKVKDIMKQAREGKDVGKLLKDLGLSDKEKAYLTSGFTSRNWNIVAMRIAKEEFVKKMAFKIAEDLIDTYEMEVGKVDITYETHGELKFLLQGHLYKVYLDRPQNNVSWINKFINNNKQMIRKINTEDELSKFLSKSFKKYKRVF